MQLNRTIDIYWQ